LTTGIISETLTPKGTGFHYLSKADKVIVPRFLIKNNTCWSDKTSNN